MKNIFSEASGFIFDIIFTVRCPYCQKIISRSEYACESCRAKFPEYSVKTAAIGNYPCVSPFLYKDIFADAIKSFKFKNCGTHARRLALMMAKSINESYDTKGFDMITCVPMHKNSLRQRRYNQAELLARECARLINLPFVQTLEQYKENEAQHSIKASKRAENVRGVYKIIDKSTVKNKSVLLIDDIITTGNTLGECAKILKLAGCKKISCATFCATAYRR